LGSCCTQVLTPVRDDVNPWNVTAKDNTGVDYDKLIGKSVSGAFGVHVTNKYI